MTKLAIAAALGLLALIPSVTLAQMGPRMGQGSASSMRSAGPPGTQARETEPAKAPAPPPAGTMTQAEMSAHMPAPRRFYEERTFLALVGAGAASAGLVIYRAARGRWRRRSGPASFVTEAVLVVDLVGSTHLATHFGDGLAMQARTVLKDRILAAAGPHELVFAENTGDGYFTTFASVESAVRTAFALLKDLRDRPLELSPAPPIDVRAGIAYGEILLDARGVRHGKVINKAFRLEGLTPEGFVEFEGRARDEIPERNHVFLDEEAAEEARSAGIAVRRVGFSRLKGFAGLHEVYEVHR